jgi:hypothetical protein
MVAQQPPRFGQLPLDLPEPPSPHQVVTDILRDEYLRNNGDLRPFLAEIAARRPKRRDPVELWSRASILLSKSRA